MSTNKFTLSNLRQTRPYRPAIRWLIAWAHLYCIGVCAWAVLHLLFGDRWWWLFLLNSFAEYLFVPVPLLLALALLTRRREIWIGFGVVLALAAYLYGGLLLPRFPPTTPSGPTPTITVMTSNVLGFNAQTEQVVGAIQAADADVVALQELNPLVAEVLQRDLIAKYPYQVLEPKLDVTGMGMISRYPLTPTDATLPGDWVGGPQVLDLALGDSRVTLINFHAIPPGSLEPTVLNYSTHERERQARELAAFAADHPAPLIILGDLNAADRSTAYAIIADSLSDAWRVAGWGLGHTFPGAASTGSSRPGIAGIPVPMWLVRVDYVFHSDDWQTVASWIGPWDGVSDHRPVVARLVLTQDTEGMVNMTY